MPSRPLELLEAGIPCFELKLFHAAIREAQACSGRIAAKCLNSMPCTEMHSPAGMQVRTGPLTSSTSRPLTSSTVLLSILLRLVRVSVLTTRVLFHGEQ